MKKYFTTGVTGIVITLSVLLGVPNTAFAGWTSGGFSIPYTVTAPTAPTVTLTASPTTIASGSSSTLTWSSTNATSCTASGDWSGSKATSGSQSTGALTASKNYTLTCTGAGGSANASATVTVGTPPPTVTLTASPTTIASGSSSTLTWSSTNATSCTAGGSWSGAKATSGSGGTGALTVTTTYTLTCTGAGGTSSPASATVTVSALTPSVTLTPDPAGPVAYNSQFALWWSTANVTSCTANNVDVSWTGSKTTAGGGQMIVATATKTYTIDCTGPNGPASASATVEVTGGPVAASISVSPTSVASGGSSTITWSSTNATSCTGSGHWSGSKTLSGSGGTGPLTSSPTYTLTCTGPGGSASSSATVTVTANPAPTVTLTASPTSVTSGEQSTLTWSSTNATSCTASNYWSGPKATSGSGWTQPIYEDSTYTLTCTGPGGSASANTTVLFLAENPQPMVWFSVSPTTVTSGQSATLYWSSDHVTSCTASQDWSGAKGINGSESIGPISYNRVYGITCTGPYGSVSSYAYLSLARKPVINLWAEPASITSGEGTVVGYWVMDATSCVGSGGGAGWDGARLPYSDSLSFYPVRTKTYKLTCSSLGGTTEASATVVVDGREPGKKPIFTEF